MTTSTAPAEDLPSLSPLTADYPAERAAREYPLAPEASAMVRPIIEGLQAAYAKGYADALRESA